jgi:hypothetical protein
MQTTKQKIKYLSTMNLERKWVQIVVTATMIIELQFIIKGIAGFVNETLIRGCARK